MMSVEELQSAVAKLTVEELDRFSQWLEEFLSEQWDRRIDADILAGRLDTAGNRADGEFENGAVHAFTVLKHLATPDFWFIVFSACLRDLEFSPAHWGSCQSLGDEALPNGDFADPKGIERCPTGIRQSPEGWSITPQGFR